MKGQVGCNERRVCQGSRDKKESIIERYIEGARYIVCIHEEQMAVKLRQTQALNISHDTVRRST